MKVDDGARRRWKAPASCALMSALLASCGTSEPVSNKAATGEPPAPQVQAAAPTKAEVITVFRDPNCGCCSLWAERARQAGYDVRVTDRPDMASVKQRYGVPTDLASCHTSLVGGYVIEGHVPAEDVDRLLRERPKDIKGIAVAGMPSGSPGMESPDGTKEPFNVVAFGADGRTSLYRSVKG